MTRRPPIHLLFGIDRGLRVGDWKIISLRNQPWELYNMVTDRSEMHNLAVSQPERITEMVTQWNQITEETMGIKPKPVATQYVNKKDKEYSDYSGNHGPITSPQMLRKLMK
jgi:arylsulfatase A-like enzyme